LIVSLIDWKGADSLLKTKHRLRIAITNNCGPHSKEIKIKIKSKSSINQSSNKKARLSESNKKANIVTELLAYEDPEINESNGSWYNTRQMVKLIVDDENSPVFKASIPKLLQCLS